MLPAYHLGAVNMSLVTTKPVLRVSDQFQYKPGCTATEDGDKLEILALIGSRGISCSENKGADHLLGYRTADLHLCFRIKSKAKSKFSHNTAEIKITVLSYLLFLSAGTEQTLMGFLDW